MRIMETRRDLFVLHSRDIVDPFVHASLTVMNSTGTVQYQKFVGERLVSRNWKISSPLKKNNVASIWLVQNRRQKLKTGERTSF